MVVAARWINFLFECSNNMSLCTRHTLLPRARCHVIRFEFVRRAIHTRVKRSTILSADKRTGEKLWTFLYGYKNREPVWGQATGTPTGAAQGEGHTHTTHTCHTHTVQYSLYLPQSLVIINLFHNISQRKGVGDGPKNAGIVRLNRTPITDRR